MELRQLRSFVAVGEELHFARAAARVHLTPSSLSQQIKTLERAVGAQLFVRGPRHVSLTDAGEVLLAHAQALLPRVDSALSAVQEAGQGRKLLRVGLFTNNAGPLTLPILHDFTLRHPDVEIRYVDLSFAEQLTALTDHKVDVAFVRPPFSTTAVDVLPLGVEPRMVLVPTASDLADADELTMEDLADWPFLSVHALDMPVDWSDFWTLRADRGGNTAPTAPAYRTVSRYNEVLMEVAVNQSATTVPASLAAENRNPAVTPVAVAGLTCELAVASRADDSNALVKSFLDTAVEISSVDSAAV